MSIITALKARRDALRADEAGFTLIELLVVVLIIGILAAIAIPVYLGIQNNAKDAAVKTDLASDRIAVQAYITANNGTVPTAAMTSSSAALATSLGGFGWSTSTGATYVKYVVGTGSTWCYLEKSASNNLFYVTSTVAPTAAAAGATTCTAS